MHGDYSLDRIDSNYQPRCYLLLQFSLPDKLFVVWTIPSSLVLPNRMSSLQSLHLPFRAWLSVGISFDLAFTEFRQFSILNYSNKLPISNSILHRQLCYYPSCKLEFLRLLTLLLYTISRKSQGMFEKSTQSF